MQSSPGALPRTIRFSKMPPGVFDWIAPIDSGSRPSIPTRRSTTPLVPNDMIDFPVFASTSCSRLFIEKIEPLVAPVRSPSS